MALNAFDKPLPAFSFVPLTVFHPLPELLTVVVHEEILSTFNPAHVILSLDYGVVLAGFIVSLLFTHLSI